MGSIRERKRKDGSTAFFAEIVIMRNLKIVHREVRTFDRRQAASAWLKKREAELAKPDAALGAKANKRNPTLADAIDRYVSESLKEIGRTKAQVLRTIKKYEIADMQCADIKSMHILEFARTVGAGVQPQTVNNYLSHLAAVFSIALPAWGYALDCSEMESAFKVARKFGIVGPSQERDRRPTLDELDSLMSHFFDRKRRRPSSIPMHAVAPFALFSTRRLEEITRIAWDDLDEHGKRILIRDMKHPGEKIGNDVWCDLPEPALEIIRAMPRTHKEIFPYNGDSIGTAFARACKILGIEDLHFHDLRHEGISRLFEMGNNIPRVATVSGHRSWASLKRYTHIRATGDKYKDWPWLKKVIDNLTVR
jgi:integrase